MNNVKQLRQRAGGDIDVAVVLGSGLSEAVSAKFVFERIAYSKLKGMPNASLAGHAGEVFVGSWHGKRVLVFAGRVHLYQGFSARDVTYGIALAADAGARTAILTNAAGALRPEYAPGELMLITDHLNLSGANPLAGAGLDNPFVDMQNAYSPRLRAMARDVQRELREGVYASVLGPSYETPAEAAYLRSIGADAVGMSTVLETIVARQRGLEVLGVSLLTNVVGAPEVTHAEVMSMAQKSGERVADLLDGVLAKL